MYEKLPEDMKRDGNFCLWKYETRKGKKTKVPYRFGGYKANPTNKKSYATFEEITQNLDGYDGIGLGVFDDFSMIDIDHCVGEDKNLTPMAKDIVDMMDTYTEISPSGTGLRLVFRTADFEYDKSLYYIKNPTNGLEVYVAGATGRFCTITGNAIREKATQDKSKELSLVLEKYMQRPAVEKPKEELPEPVSYLTDKSVLLKAADSKQGEKFRALWTGEIPEGKSHSEADLALCAILAFWCGGDKEQIDRLFRQSRLMRDKWDEMRGADTYGNITINSAIAKSTQRFSPSFYKGSAADDFNDVAKTVAELKAESNPRYGWNDTGSGRLFADVYKNIARFVPERGKWYVYDGTRWIEDVSNMKVMELAKNLGDSLIRYALEIKDEHKRTAYMKYLASWLQRGTRCTFLSDAQSVYPISMREFDKNIYLLNCRNVTVDIKTGEAHEHNPEDKLTKIANVSFNPEAQNLRFRQFVDEVMSGDKAKAHFLQKSLGYGLTGDTRFECMFIYHGATTRNGKGTLMESILTTLGDYGLSVRPETIAAKQNVNSQNPSEDIARLAGVRFANISEPRRGLVLNEAQIKSMTGNDTLNARFLHENSFDFKPQFKLYVNTNYLPVITDMTLFSSGRIIIIPFDRHFAEHEQDKSLKQAFATEETKSAILNWLLAGYAFLMEEGFKPPQAVKDAIKAYAHDSDKIKLFSEEYLEGVSGAEAKTSDVYCAYRNWCNENGSFPENSRNFNQALRTIGTVVRKRPKAGGEKTTMITGYRLLNKDFLA